MADDIADSIDITTDLNAQGDVQPYHGDAVPMNRQPSSIPTVLPDAKGDGEKPAPSLRDTLTDAFKGTKAPEAVQPAPGAPAGGQKGNGADPAAASPSAGELIKVGDRWHRKDGAFASNEEIAAHNAAVAGQPAPEIASPWMHGMTAVEREQFKALPAETRQYVERTMAGVDARAAQLADYGMIEQVIGPRRQLWANEGMNPTVALTQLLSLSDFAGRDPGQFVLWFADQQKLDLDALMDARDAAAAAGATGAVDPHIQGLQREIAELKNAFTGYTNVSVGQQHAQNVQRVQQFVDEKDASGNLLHPYFHEVSDAIAQHVGLLRQQQPYLPEAELLKAAYDFATYSNPQIREKTQQEALKATQDRMAQEAARARQAGVSINGGPAGDSGHAPNNANRTLRDELVAAYNSSTLQ